MFRVTVTRPAKAGILALALTGGLAAQTTIHVAPWGNDSWSGHTNAHAGPQGPKLTLQAAINAATNGDSVMVEDGTYTGPGNRDLDLGGRVLTVRSTGGSTSCTIDCEGSQAEPHRAFWCHSGESLASVIDGFTITHGFAGFGGAILIEGGSSLTLRNCVFRDNTAFPATTGGEGGAIRCVGGSPRVEACRFVLNRALRVAGVGGRGGAIQFVGSSPTLTYCTFLQNTAGGGGGIHSTSGTIATMSCCSFEGNWTADPTFNGGGGYLGSVGGLHTFVDCRFVENTTARIAGAVWVTQSTAASVVRCAFLRNHGFDGGCFGVANGSSASISDSLFAGNTADIFSAGIDVWNGPPTGAPASATVTNCTFADNTTTAGYGVIVVEHTSQVSGSNNVMWGNAPAAIRLFDSGNVAFSWSDVEGGWPGVGNIAADPLFVGSGPRPYALSVASPCVDTGDPVLVAPTMRDLAGGFRVWDGNGDLTPRVDLGAYEFGVPRGDLNCDGTVDPEDLQILLQNRGIQSGSYWTQGDLDGDGDVDSTDLLLLVFAMGASLS